jgi:hypothetical protein
MRNGEEMLILLLPRQGGGGVFVAFPRTAAPATGIPEVKSFHSAIVSRLQPIEQPASRLRNLGTLKS